MADRVISRLPEEADRSFVLDGKIDEERGLPEMAMDRSQEVSPISFPFKSRVDGQKLNQDDPFALVSDPFQDVLAVLEGSAFGEAIV